MVISHILKLNKKTTSLILGIPEIAALFVIIILSFYTGLKNYLLFHSITELICICIGFTSFIIAITTFEVSDYKNIVFLGIIYGFVSLLDMFHLVADSGINILPDTSNLSVQMRIAARYFEGISIAVSLIFMPRKFKNLKIPLIILSIAAGFLLSSIFLFKIFPDCIVKGTKLTMFKIISEYVITAIFILSIFILMHNHKNAHPIMKHFLIWSLVIRIISEFCFALYSGPNSTAIICAHILKFVSYFFIYRAIIHTSLKAPYLMLNQLNNELEEKNSHLISVNQKLFNEIKMRELTEMELKESKDNYKVLLKMMPEAILVTYMNGKIAFANNAFAKMSGASDFHEIIGLPISKVLPPQQDFGEKVKERMLLNNNSRVPVIEQKRITMSGKVIDVEIASTPFVYKGKPSILYIIRDITELKRAEQLQAIVEEKNRELEKNLEIDRLKTEFFTNISHELRTPLNVIMSIQQLLTLNLKDVLSQNNFEDTARHMKIMKQNCYRLVKLINNLIDITKIDSGYLQLKLENCNIVSVVEDITLSVAEYIEHNNISLIFDTDVEEKIMACDPDKIERIMLNLLSNAMKFTKPGGSIFVTVYDGDEYVSISVKDTGVGIPPEMLDTIFERFKQAGKYRQLESCGSGIGLALVKSLVEMHKGQICVKSTIGVGSEFIIKLPVQVLPETPSTEPDISHILQNHAERINIEFSDIYS